MNVVPSERIRFEGNVYTAFCCWGENIVWACDIERMICGCWGSFLIFICWGAWTNVRIWVCCCCCGCCTRAWEVAGVVMTCFTDAGSTRFSTFIFFLALSTDGNFYSKINVCITRNIDTWSWRDLTLLSLTFTVPSNLPSQLARCLASWALCANCLLHWGHEWRKLCCPLSGWILSRNCCETW